MFMQNTALFMLVALLMAPVGVFGAQIYIDPELDQYTYSDIFSIPVRIDTQGECINALDVAIAYDPSKVRVVDVLTGDSIITLWVVRPTIDAENGRVIFMGGIPGGYCGRLDGDLGTTNTLARLMVTAVRQADINEHTISIMIESSTAATVNDGSGNLIEMTLLGSDIKITTATGTPVNSLLQDIRSDTIAPEDFEITLVRGPSEGNTSHYIVFNTVDKQSGISHYEVLETDPEHFGLLTWISRRTHWVRANSPYVLRDQSLRSTIMVKAVDKNGNERIVAYTPPMSPLVPFTKMSFFVPLLILLSVPLILLALLVRLIRVRARFEEKDAYEKAKSEQPYGEQ
jgi:hypothetical protein